MDFLASEFSEKYLHRKILVNYRCKCKEKFLITKKRKRRKKRKRLNIHSYPIQYPKSESIPTFSKTFQIKSKKNLSIPAKMILNSFQKKYLYYAIDDILYLLKSSFEEKNYILEILYSPILSLHNNFSINFFDIWISEIYIEKISKSNRFLNSKNEILTQDNIITFKFFYKLPVPAKKRESLW